MEIVRNKEGARYTPAGHDASVQSRIIYKNGIDTHVTTFPPRSGMEEEVHEDKTHVFYVLQGKMDVLQHGKLLGTLEADDAVVIHAGELHEISNNSDSDVVFLAITFKQE